MRRVPVRRADGCTRDIVEEPQCVVAVESSERRRDRSRHGVCMNGGEAKHPKHWTLLHRDALHTRVWHDHQRTPDGSGAQQHRGVREREAVASPREPPHYRRPSRGGGEAIGGALRREPPNGEFFDLDEVGQHQSEHPPHVIEGAHREQGRVLLTGRSPGRRITRTIDLDLPPSGHPPQQRLSDLDGVDATGRKGLTACRQEPEADPKPIGRARDREPQRFRESLDVEARDTDSSGDKRHESDESDLFLKGASDNGGDCDENYPHREAAEQNRSDQAARRHAHDRVGFGRVRVELGSEKIVDPALDDRSGLIRLPHHGCPARARCPAQDLVAQILGGTRSQVLELHVRVVARLAHLEP